MKVTIVSIPDCPNVGLAEARVRWALARTELDGLEPEHRTIESHEQAVAEGFQGSPTIQIDGIDPFPNYSAPASFACRVYSTEHGVEGAPSPAQLEAAFRAAAAQG